MAHGNRCAELSLIRGVKLNTHYSLTLKSAKIRSLDERKVSVT